MLGGPGGRLAGWAVGRSVVLAGSVAWAGPCRIDNSQERAPIARLLIFL